LELFNIYYRIYVSRSKQGDIGYCQTDFCKYNCGMDNKMGRPTRDPGGEASKLFPVRLTALERAQYERAAKRAKMTVSEWMRDRLTKAAKRESKRD
jgi:hypothetical protein